mgnify:CR=1 FL=1
MRALLVLICIFALQSDEQIVKWQYAGNDSTLRMYTIHNGELNAISEFGNDIVDWSNTSDVPVTTITLQGDVDDGSIAFTPYHNTCWSIDMTSDYNLLNRHWQSTSKFYHVFLPQIVQ